MPVGVEGELCAGGDGLSRGYHRRPGRTAERFVPDPFGDGGRLYRTGDRVRWLADGRLGFVGRAGGYVKLRGFRVEPGEVEVVLAEHPAVGAAAVAARGEGGEDLRLVAWVVPAAGVPAPGAEALGRFLGERLPAYMVPAAYVAVDALPLTANGKVDRAALPDPAPAAPAGSGRAPRGPVEARLAGLVAEVLGLASVGRDDDFFALGGNSLSATRLVARVRRQLGRELPLRRVFESPTVASLATALGAAPLPAPGPAPGDERPLSFGQERLWMLQRLDPESRVYDVRLPLRLRGPLRPELLAHCLTEVRRRHQVLRSRLVSRQGRSFAEVLPVAPVRLPRVDLSALPPERREMALAAAVSGRGEPPFDLAAGDLLRVRLIRLAPADHLLALTVHHAAFDGASLHVLVRELSALYAAFSSGGRSPLPEPVLQYSDHAAWQRRCLDEGLLAAELDYWRQGLAGLPPVELPTDRPRPPVQRHRGDRLEVRLPASLAGGVLRLARSSAATPFAAFLALVQVLLARWSGGWDIAVGAPVSNRTWAEQEELIGFFTNTLVLRTRLDPGAGLAAAVERAQRASLEAQAHRELPFERLVAELSPQRNLDRNPLFQTLFALQEAPLPADRLGPVHLELGDAGRLASPFDLALWLWDDGAGGFTGSLQYDRDLFDRTTMLRLLGRFERLAEAAGGEPAVPAARLDLLAPAERHALTCEWNGAGSPPEPVLAGDVFEHTARRQPGAPAVVSPQGSWTYGELDRRSDRLAARLQARGVGPEVVVAVGLGRCPELLVALLAVWKAGGVYLPVDPVYPAERLAFMLADSGAALLVTGEPWRRSLPPLAAPHRPLPRLDVGGEEEAGAEPSPPPASSRRPAPEALAWMIYTSGSTGRPKAVAVSHRGVAALVAAQRRRFARRASDRVLLFASPSFDASLFEILMAFDAGAALHLAAPERVLAGAELAACLRSGAVTTLTTSPSTLASLRPEELPDLETVVAAGEALPEEVARRWAGRRLFNAYGPTEATIWATVHRCRPGDATPPIGRPIEGVQAHVLDAAGARMPVGAVGELVLAGPGLARGYAGRPALTAERFVPDAFARRPGARLYRTGDRALRSADGDLCFRGRLDHQVKVRGFRIELGEVEAVARCRPDVDEAVAVVGDERLVLYVGGSSPDAEGLRARLAEELPGFMVPAAVIVLGALPRTAAGKVDRSRLPAPWPAASDEAPAAAPAASPGSELEKQIAASWCRVLDRPGVGLDDNFFDLGGHSLLLARVHEELVEDHPDLALLSLFTHPTVRSLAVYLEGGEEAAPQAGRDRGELRRRRQGRAMRRRSAG